VEKSGKYGRFWACPNYRENGCKESVDIDPKPWAKDAPPTEPESTEPDPDGGEFVDL